MTRHHLKRLPAPKSWRIKRKGIKFVANPRPGKHPLKFSMPVVVMLRDILGYAKTAREVKHILSQGNLIIDGKVIKDPRYGVGLFDIVSFPKIKEYYRVILDEKGNLTLIKIPEEETTAKLYRINNKHLVKGGKIQINLYDGTNILVDKDAYKVGDSVIISFQDKKIKKHLPFEKGSLVYLIGGKHIGRTGTVSEIIGKFIKVKKDNEEIITMKKFAFAIGKNKPEITIK